VTGIFLYSGSIVAYPETALLPRRRMFPPARVF
jgi:hypothetical protein